MLAPPWSRRRRVLTWTWWSTEWSGSPGSTRHSPRSKPLRDAPATLAVRRARHLRYGFSSGVSRKEFIRLAYGEFKSAAKEPELVAAIESRIERGENRVDPDKLNELDRQVLKEAFKQAKRLQSRLQLEYRL